MIGLLPTLCIGRGAERRSGGATRNRCRAARRHRWALIATMPPSPQAGQPTDLPSNRRPHLARLRSDLPWPSCCRAVLQVSLAASKSSESHAIRGSEQPAKAYASVPDRGPGMAVSSWRRVQIMGVRRNQRTTRRRRAVIALPVVASLLLLMTACGGTVLVRLGRRGRHDHRLRRVRDPDRGTVGRRHPRGPECRDGGRPDRLQLYR